MIFFFSLIKCIIAMKTNKLTFTRFDKYVLHIIQGPSMVIISLLIINFPYISLYHHNHLHLFVISSSLSFSSPLFFSSSSSLRYSGPGPYHHRITPYSLFCFHYHSFLFLLFFIVHKTLIPRIIIEFLPVPYSVSIISSSFSSSSLKQLFPLWSSNFSLISYSVSIIILLFSFSSSLSLKYLYPVWPSTALLPPPPPPP